MRVLLMHVIALSRKGVGWSVVRQSIHGDGKSWNGGSGSVGGDDVYDVGIAGDGM